VNSPPAATSSSECIVLTSAEVRKHAWEYFQFHAQQRLTTFNFFLVFSTLLLGGLLTTFQDRYGSPVLGVGVGVLLVLISFVFWRLDRRNRQLIKNAEDALREEERSWGARGAEGALPTWAVFRRDAAYVARVRKRQRRLGVRRRHYSYSACFEMVYIAVATTGAIGAILALLSVIGSAQPCLQPRGGSKPEPLSGAALPGGREWGVDSGTETGACS
jgi:hypothetical protein